MKLRSSQVASIRKRTWQSGGETKAAWVADYFDQAGKRRLKTFATKKAADAWLVEARGEVARGAHIPDHDAPTVAEAAERWLASAEARGLERSTIEGYRQHRAHILPQLGSIRLSRLTEEDVIEFRDHLLRTMSRPMASKVMVTLRAILRRGKRPIDVRLERNGQQRHQERLEVGRDIPTPAEVRTLLTAATGAAGGILALAALAGLRASELRGLRWDDLDFRHSQVTIRQRADRWGKIGSPKSRDSRRTVPLGPEAARILREWRLACPRRVIKGDDGEIRKELWPLVFPTKAGTPHLLGNLSKRVLRPVQLAAGIGPYGLHSFRHFYASWQLSQGVSLKVLQHRMGHSTIILTSDRYGHLMPESADDRARADAAERALLA